MKRERRITWVLALSSMFCFATYFIMIFMSFPSAVRASAGLVTIELVEPTPNMALSGVVPFKVKIIAGNPRIIRGMRLELVQERGAKIGPFEMSHIYSSPPHSEEFWYTEIDASKVPDGRYDARILAYESEGSTVGELTSTVEVGKGGTAGTYRDWFSWLGGILAIISLIAYFRKI
jgi:hypothetical protein